MAEDSLARSSARLTASVGERAAPLAPRVIEAPAGECEPLAEVLDFETLYERHFDFVWRSLRLLGIFPSGLEDAAQEVFTTVARRLDAFEGRSSLRTWIFGIAQRVAANQRRSQRRKLSFLEPLEDPIAASDPSPEARAEARQALAWVEAFSETLSEDRRGLFVLALVEGVPAPEIAPALGLPLNTVYSRIRALRLELKRSFLQRDGTHHE